MGIFIAVIVTFIVTALWHAAAERKNKKLTKIVVLGILGEMDILSKGLGYKDIHEYWEKQKGDDYARNASNNIKQFLNL